MSASFPESGHANLSALQVIGSSVASLLGPVKGVKCLFNEDSNEGLLVTSTNELLQGLDIEHPVGQLAREFCLSQHKRHGSSCTTLVTLAGLWAANVQSLLNQDVPIQNIIRVGDEFLQECEEVAEQCTISIHSLPKPATAASRREEDWDGMMLHDSSSSLEGSYAEEPRCHRDVTRSEVTEIDSVSLNQNSNNSCALPCRTTLKSTTLTGSSGHEKGKHSLISDFESTCTFSPVQKHAIPFPTASSAKPNTSSAIVKDNDDDVSWFFENDSQYGNRAKDVTSTAAGQLANLEQFSLHGHKQNDSSCGEKLMEEEDIDDVEWFFEENEEVNRMRADSCDALPGNSHDTGKSSTNSMYEEKGKDVCLEVTGLKEAVQQRAKTRETTSQPLYGLPPLKSGHYSEEKDEQAAIAKGVHSVIKQRLQASSSQERSSTKVSPIQKSVQLESLLKSAIEQKPSKLLKGSRRILSRHLLEDEQETSGLPGASDVPVIESKPKQTSSDFGQHHLKDEKTSVVPNSTRVGTTCTSDHFLHRDAMQSVRVRKQNVDIPQMLADDVMRTREMTRKAEESHTIAELGDSLSHGADAEMKLATEACQAQLIASQEQHRFAFSPELVHVQTLTGPPSSSSCCIHGLVLPCHENQLNTLHTITGRSMIGLLLNSDLQESYRHRGFKDSLKSSSTVSGIPTSVEASISAWTDRVVSVLKKLNVNLLMVRGSVDSSLVDACCFHNILILDHVPYRLLQLLVTVHRSSLLTYIPDALQDDLCENIQLFYWSSGYDPHPTVISRDLKLHHDDVCENIKVSYWSSGYDPHPTVRSRDLKLQHHVRIVCPGDVMTIVLCAPTAPHLAGAEQRLHSCMARLRGALHDGKVLPGGGRIEQHLVEKLSQQSGYVADFHNYHHGLVYKALAQGFAAYIQHTHLNMGQLQVMAEDASPDSTGCHGSPSSNVHDCFSAKKGAWQKAWHLVKQVLLCDALIVTGVDKGDRHLDRVL